MILLVDNYDSFTYNLVDYFNQLFCDVDVKRNDETLDCLCSDTYNGVVFSPGPETPEKANNLIPTIEFYLSKKPILGICLGHQAIAKTLGAELTHAEKPMHGKISRITNNPGVLFQDLPKEFDVVRYHSLVNINCPDSIIPTAKSSNGELMAFDTRPDLMAHGLQFHPEAILTQYGLEMLRNWLTFYNIV